MSFVVNIYNDKHKKTQNPRYDMLFNNNISNSKNRFRMPLAGTRKELDCGNCVPNTKVKKDNILSEACIKVCYKGNSRIKRSKDGIITNSNFRFTHMEVLERNNKTFEQNSAPFTISQSFNTNNGGVKCGSSTISNKSKFISSKSRTLSVKNDAIKYSQCTSCPPRDENGKVLYPTIDIPCQAPSRINGKLQSCPAPKQQLPNKRLNNRFKKQIQPKKLLIQKPNQDANNIMERKQTTIESIVKKQTEPIKREIVNYTDGLNYTIRNNNVYLNWNKYTDTNFISYNLYSNDILLTKIVDSDILNYFFPYDNTLYNDIYLQINYVDSKSELSTKNYPSIIIYNELSIQEFVVHSVNNGIRIDFTLNEPKSTTFKFYKRQIIDSKWELISNNDLSLYLNNNLYSNTITNLKPHTKYMFKMEAYRNNTVVFKKNIDLERIIVSNVSLRGFINIYESFNILRNYTIQFNIDMLPMNTSILSFLDRSNLTEGISYLNLKVMDSKVVLSFDVGEKNIVFNSKNIIENIQTENFFLIELCGNDLNVFLNNNNIIKETFSIFERSRLEHVFVYLNENLNVKNLFIKEYILPIDKTAPIIPKNFKLKQIQNKLEISWDFSKDIDTELYNIYRNGVLFQTFFHSDIEKGLIYDTDIVLGLSYTYEIEAIDFDGNKSEKVIDTIKIVDDNVKKINVFSIESNNESLKLSWNKNTENTFVKQYNVLKKIKDIWIQIATILNDDRDIYSYIDTNVINGKIFYYKIEVENIFGFKSKENIIENATPYRMPQINTFDGNPGIDQICLSWSKSTSGIFKGYVIDKTPKDANSKIIFPIFISNIDTINLVDYGLQRNTKYIYTIREYTVFSSYSPEKKISITTNTMESNDFIFNNPTTNNLVESSRNFLNLVWFSELIGDFLYYDVYVNDGTNKTIREKQLGENSVQINGLIFDKKYDIQILEFDELNQIINSYYFNGTPFDEPPKKIENLRVVSNEKNISLFWDKNTEYDVYNYILYKNNAKLVELNKNTTSYVDNDVKLGKKYLYKIVVSDIRGNLSNASMGEGMSEIVPGDPQVPNHFKTINYKRKLTLMWDNNIDLDFEKYKIYRNDAILDTIFKNMDKYYHKVNISYDKTTYSSIKNGGDSGQDKTISAFWNHHLQDVGWIADINRGMTVYKGSDIFPNSHWIQLELPENIYVLGLIFKNISNSIYVKKMAIKTSLYKDNWHNETWVEFSNNNSLYLNETTTNIEIELFFKGKHLTKYIRIYVLEYNDDAGLKFSLLYDSKPNSKIIYNDYNVNMGNKYQYQISAIDFYNREMFTDKIEAEPKDPFPGAPSEPTNVILTNIKKYISIQWDKNPENDISHYKIYKREKSELLFNFFTINDTSNNLQSIETSKGIKYTYIDKNVIPDETYYYKIVAVDIDLNESNSIVKKFTNIDQPPQPISIFNITPENNKIKLNWEKSKESDILKYKIYRSSKNLNNYNHISDINHVDNNETNYTYYDINVINGMKYYYSIQVVDTSNNTSSLSYSDPLFCIPVNKPPKKPLIREITSRNGSLNIEIEKNTIETDIFNYRLYRKTVDSTYILVHTFLPTVFKNNFYIYNDLNLTNGVKYTYRLNILDKFNLSTNSDEKTGTPIDDSPPNSISITNIESFYNKIKLNWEISLDTKFFRYNIYRNDKYIYNTKETSFIDNINLQPNKSYNYSITVVNNKMIEGKKSNVVSGKLKITWIPNIIINKIGNNFLKFQINSSLPDNITFSPLDTPIIRNKENDYLRVNINNIRYKVHLKTPTDFYEKTYIYSNKNIEILDLSANTNYSFYVELEYNGVLSEKSDTNQITTSKNPTLAQKEITLFTYNIINEQINLNWDIVDVWDISNILLNVKIDSSNNNITNMYTLEGNTDNYQINDFYKNSKYVISLQYNTLSGGISKEKKIEFQTEKPENELLYDENIKLLNRIENISYNSVSSYVFEINFIDNVIKHILLEERFKKVKERLNNELIILKSRLETKNKITEINETILKNDYNELLNLKNTLDSFIVLDEDRSKFNIAKNNLDSVIQEKKSLIDTEKNIALLEKSIVEKNIDEMLELQSSLQNFVPNTSLSYKYQNKYNLFVIELNNLNLDIDREIETKNYIKKITNILNFDKNFIKIENLLLEIGVFSPSTNLKSEFDKLFLELTNLRNNLYEIDLKRYDWYSSGIQEKSIQIGNNKLLEWRNTDLNDLIITVEKRNNNYFFNWFSMDKYLNKSSFLYLSIKNKNRLLNVNLFKYVLKVDVVRKINNEYIYVSRNINIEVIKNKYYDFFGIIRVLGSFVLMNGDMLVKGNSWVFMNDIFLHIYDFVNIPKDNYKGDISFKNKFSSILRKDIVDNDLDVNVLKKFESYVRVDSNDKNYIYLKRAELMYPNRDLKDISLKGIGFFVKNWKSKNLITFGDISITHNSYINPEYISKFTNVDGLNLITFETSNYINIYNKSDWIFVYIEFQDTITKLSKHNIKFSSLDGEMYISKLHFYRTNLTKTQLKIISEMDPVKYDFEIGSNTISTIFSEGLSVENSINEREIVISKQLDIYGKEPISKSFYKSTNTFWMEIPIEYSTKKIKLNDLYTENGFDNLIKAKQYALKIPNCYNIMKIDNKFWLMERNVPLIKDNSKKGWLLKKYIRSYSNWYRLYETIRSVDSNTRLEIPDLVVYNKLKNTKLLNENLSYIYFEIEGDFYDLLINNNVKTIENETVLKSDVGYNIVGGNDSENSEFWISLINRLPTDTSLYKMRYNIGGVEKNIYILFYKTFVSKNFLTDELLEEFLN